MQDISDEILIKAAEGDLESLIQLRTNNQFNTSEQAEYLSQLTDVSTDLPANDEKEFGTLVEQYFL